MAASATASVRPDTLKKFVVVVQRARQTYGAHRPHGVFTDQWVRQFSAVGRRPSHDHGEDSATKKDSARVHVTHLWRAAHCATRNPRVNTPPLISQKISITA